MKRWLKNSTGRRNTCRELRRLLSASLSSMRSSQLLHGREHDLQDEHGGQADEQRLSHPSNRLTRMSSTKALVAPGRTSPGIIRPTQPTKPIAGP